VADFFHDKFCSLFERVTDVDSGKLFAITKHILQTRENGGKVIVVGNGGSAAIASHVAVDLTKVAGFRAVSFNEAALLTCLSNDYGYDRWIEKALEFYADLEDLIIIVSSSGESENMLKAGRFASEFGLTSVTFSGFLPENSLRNLGCINMWVDSIDYNIVENTHQIWLLSVIDLLIKETGGRQ